MNLCPSDASLTFLQLVHGSDLGGAVDAEDEADALRQVDVVGQGAGQVSQQPVEGAEAVSSHGVHDALEVAVPVAVEAHLLGFLLVAEGLQGARAVEAAVGAVGGARQPVHSGSSGGSGAFVPFIEVSKVQLHGYKLRNRMMRSDWGAVGLL